MSPKPKIILVGEFTDADRRSLEGLGAVEIVETPSAAADVLRETSAAVPVAMPEGAGQESPASSLTDQTVPAEIMLDGIHEGVALVDPDGRIQFCNRRFREFVADPTAELLSKALGCPADVHPQLTDLGPAKGEPTQFRVCAAEKHLEVELRPLEGRWLCTVRDITFDVGQREKLLTIQRAGRELNRLTAEELARMSTSERIDLLKANIIQYSQKLLDFRNLEIRLLDRESGRLNILVSEGVPGGLERELHSSIEGNGVTGYVAATGKSYLLRSVERDPHYLPGAVDAKSSLTVPILDRGRTIGVFNVESPRPGNFTENDREFLEVFAAEIAQAIETLDLLQAEKQIERTAAADAMLDRIAVPTDAIWADAVRLRDAFSSRQQAPTKNPNEPTPEEPTPDAEFQRYVNSLLDSIGTHAREIKRSVLQVGRMDAAESRPTWATRLAGKRVLVVDADLGIRQSAYRLLARLGCEAYTVGESREAIGVIRSLPYDVVVADAEMPDLDGYQLFLRVQELRPTLPFVLMKGFGYDANHTLVKARQAGLRVFLYKPFRIDRLAEALEDALFPGAGGPKPSGETNPPNPQNRKTNTRKQVG